MPEQPDGFDPLRDRLQAALGDEYEVGRRLGAGGMGCVYSAREVPLKRSVAVKVLRPELATARAAERFLREAQLLAAVEHPSVVTIHHVGRPDQGLYFFVMELLTGTLADQLREGAMPEQDVVQLGIELLNGLDRVHRTGIVHRDIKPSNVFLQEGKSAKLGDFGIAHADLVELTEPGISPGTPAYMAPEQWRQEPVGPRADLYSLSMVLYEALTRRRWPTGADPDRGDWTGVRRQVRATLGRGLAPNPADRWPDARAFARALEVTQPGDWVPPALVGGLVVAVLFGLVVLWRLLRPMPLSDVAVLPLRVDGGSPARGELLAIAIQLNLERAFGDSGLRVTPTSVSSPWMAARDTGSALPSTAWKELQTKRILRGRARVAGDSVDIETELLESNGEARSLGHVRDALSDEWRVGSLVALDVVRVVRGCTGCFKGPSGDTSRTAWEALVDAEYAFQHDQWDAAEAFYRRALERDSSLALATWGLFNVRRWERATTEADVRALAATYRRHAREFGEIDRLLISADIAPTVPERLAIYDSAIRLFPSDVYPRLLRGNELFHRGALVGKGLDSAIAALELATRGTQYASTYSMLTWAYTRRGDAAKARNALASYARIAPSQPVEGFDMRSVLDLAWDMRFLPEEEWNDTLRQVLNNPEGPGSLARAVRLGLAFGVPRAQFAVGRYLDLNSMRDPAIQAQGLTTESLALLAMGQPREALGKLEQATRVSGDDEYAFQAQEWRLALPALGVPGFPLNSQMAARAAMEHAAEEGPRVGRARWMLLLDALAVADTARAASWLARLDSAPGAAALHAVGTALLLAATGDTASAIRRSDSLVLHTLVADVADPLHRVVLYLSRGRWLADRDPAAADAAWRWYENADLRQWPSGPPQAAELDWAMEAFARSLRARLALAAGDRPRACTILPQLEAYWTQGDSGYVALAEQLRASAGVCGRT